MPAHTLDARGDRLYDGISGGDWLRRYFRQQFGRHIAARWFD